MKIKTIVLSAAVSLLPAFALAAQPGLTINTQETGLSTINLQCDTQNVAQGPTVDFPWGFFGAGMLSKCKLYSDSAAKHLVASFTVDINGKATEGRITALKDDAPTQYRVVAHGTAPVQRDFGKEVTIYVDKK